MVAPSIESNNAARKPDRIMPYVIMLGMGMMHQMVNPMMQLPIKEPSVPIRVIPPDRPWSIGRSDIMDKGLCFESFPNSVAHVSAIAAETLEKNRKIRIGSL